MELQNIFLRCFCTNTREKSLAAGPRGSKLTSMSVLPVAALDSSAWMYECREQRFSSYTCILVIPRLSVNGQNAIFVLRGSKLNERCFHQTAQVGLLSCQMAKQEAALSVGAYTPPFTGNTLATRARLATPVEKTTSICAPPSERPREQTRRHHLG